MPYNPGIKYLPGLLSLPPPTTQHQFLILTIAKWRCMRHILGCFSRQCVLTRTLPSDRSDIPRHKPGERADTEEAPFDYAMSNHFNK